jgi:phosphohistidine phosphatase
MNQPALKEIYVMRHGEAHRRATTDAARELTDRGRQEVADNALALPQDIDLLAVSPYVRAQQTARIVVDSVGMGAQMDTLDLITPAGVPREIEAWLQAKTFQKALLVTHQPFAGQFVEYLTESACYNFPTAGIARVRLEMLGRGLGRFQWLTA